MVSALRPDCVAATDAGSDVHVCRRVSLHLVRMRSTIRNRHDGNAE
jgi:hypothetical protein